MNSNLSGDLDRARQQMILQEKAMVELLTPAIDKATHSLRQLGKAFEEARGNDVIYVTVGHPSVTSPILDRVRVLVTEKTKVQSAKMLRKLIADHITEYGFESSIKMRPAELYYVVWLYAHGNYEYYWSSDNAPQTET